MADLTILFRQSHLWPEAITYPPEPGPADEFGSCTSSMIPVSHLARNGMAPIAMGMVLCNDTNIDAYVNMVQGLHAEGVVSIPSSLTFGRADFDHSLRRSISRIRYSYPSSSCPRNSIRQTHFNVWESL